MLHEQLIVGMAAGLILSAVLRWTPSWRVLLTAAVAASLIDYAINSPAIRKLAGGQGTPSGEIAVYPHVCPCIALAFIGVLAVLHVLRQ
jgi:hypothetical protein